MHKYSAILAALALLITSTVSTSFRTNNFRYGNYQPSQDQFQSLSGQNTPGAKVRKIILENQPISSPKVSYSQDYFTYGPRDNWRKFYDSVYNNYRNQFRQRWNSYQTSDYQSDNLNFDQKDRQLLQSIFQGNRGVGIRNVPGMSDILDSQAASYQGQRKFRQGPIFY